MLDKRVKMCYNIYRKKERYIKMTNIKWNYIGTIEAMGEGFDQYESEDGTLGKNVWFDGYEEIFEIG